MRSLFISEAGVIEGVYSDSLLPLISQGRAEIKRASHVEPGVDDSGNPCWFADMSPSSGPVLGPYYTRQDALDKEVEWLLENRFRQ